MLYLGLGHLSTKEFLAISTVGRFRELFCLPWGGLFLRYHQYYRFSLLLGFAIVVVFLVMLYKESWKDYSGLHTVQGKKSEGEREQRD